MSLLNSMNITQKLILAFTCLMAASLLSYGMIYWQRASLEQSLDWTSHTHEVLEEVDGLSLAMVNQETGLRGFMITGVEDSLTPYKNGLRSYQEHLVNARKLTADNSEQQKRLAEVEAAVSEWHTKVANVAIAHMAKAETRDLAHELERTGAGRKSFGSIRSKLEEVASAERALLERRSEEKSASLAAITYAIVIGMTLMVVVTIGFVMLLTRAISKPVADLTSAMGALASGDLATEVPGTDRGDEIGSMAQAVQVFKDNMISADALRAEQMRSEEEKEKRQRLVTEAIRSFETIIGRIVDTVSSTSGQLETAAGTLTKTAETTQQLSSMVASASEQTSVNVQGVAAASEQLSSTVSEIGRQVQESSSIAGQAVMQATKTNESVTELSRSADRIGDVIGLINTIAGQTNLLALNATIEAARAGDAGKGFAVVAQEVKALADQTAKATSEIAMQIANMQSATQDAVVAIQEIAGTINKMSEISGAIAAAVEEQGATTQEISRNVMEAAKGTSEVASSITDVSRGASETGAESANVLSSAKHLSAESTRLRSEVERFLTTVRAA
jgi:methyl-accepting chemotaxis protein